VPAARAVGGLGRRVGNLASVCTEIKKKSRNELPERFRIYRYLFRFALADLVVGYVASSIFQQ